MAIQAESNRRRRTLGSDLSGELSLNNQPAGTVIKEHQIFAKI